MNDPRPLKYVAPATAEADLKNAPEPVAIYDLPTGGGAVSWADVTGKPATFPPTTGTTAATAAPGNHNHAVTADAASGLAAAANIQALAVALSARIKALEDATP